VAGVAFGLGFVPIGQCLGFIALSAWLNVYLSVRYPACHRLSTPFATVMLGYDIPLAGCST
jgi:two-component system sensor histidine kinase RegB